MTHNEMAAYMSQLTPMEQKVLQIAASHLETSFSLVKSIGFQEWQAQQQLQQRVQEVPQAPEPTHKALPTHKEPAPLKKLKIKKKLVPSIL